MVLHLINSNVYRVNDYRQSKRLEAMVSKSPLFHFGPPKVGTKSRHSSTMVTWKCEYVWDIVVSPLRVTTSDSAPSFVGVTIDVPDTFIVGVGLSSVVFSNVAWDVVITKVGVFVKPTNACS